MEEIWIYVFRILETLAFAVPVAIIINILIIPMLSPKMKYRYKYICKIVIPCDIKLEMVSKAWCDDTNNLSVDNMKRELISHLNSNRYRPRDNDDSISIIIGSTTIDMSFYVKEVTEEYPLVSDGLEIRYSNRSVFRKLDRDLIDLLGAKDRMRKILDVLNFKVSIDFSIVCTVNGMARAKILLDTARSVTVNYKTNDGYNFELYDDKIVCHGNTMSGEIPSIIRKIIVTYS